MKDDIPGLVENNRVEQKHADCRNFIGPMLELCRYQQSATRVDLLHMPAYLQSFLYLRAASRSRLLDFCRYDKTAGTEYEEKGHATTKLTRRTRNERYGIMTKQSVVQDYKHPQPGTTSTFTVDEKVRREVWNSGIRRPKGYVVSYHANPDMEKMHFGPKHPMKPWRLTLTNKIVLAYGMHEAMDLYIPRAATPQELKEFHREDYIEFLQRYSSYFYLNTFKNAE